MCWVCPCLVLQADSQLSQGARLGRFGSSDRKKGDEGPLLKICRDTTKLSAEQIKGLSSQVIKTVLFNCNPKAGGPVRLVTADAAQAHGAAAPPPPADVPAAAAAAGAPAAAAVGGAEATSSAQAAAAAGGEAPMESDDNAVIAEVPAAEAAAAPPAAAADGGAEGAGQPMET